MIARMIRAAKLEVALYEEVEHDKSANKQALLVVVLSSLAAGIGGVTSGGLVGLISGVFVALASWAIWAGITLFIGTKLLAAKETEADYGQLLRTLGFASSPGVLRVFGVIPFVGGLVNLVIGVWMLVATVIAVRQALDYTSTWRAVGVVIIGWLVQMAILMIFIVFVL